MSAKSSSKSRVRLAPRERLNRGLRYTALGPVDITRGALGITAHSAQSAYESGRAALHRRYEAGRLRHELEAAQEVVANLPQALQEARKPKRRRRPLVLAAVAVAVLGGGAVAFSVVRRTRHSQEPSSLPPSVEVTPKP